MQVEFFDDAPPGPDTPPDEVVPERAGRLPRWFLALLVVAACAITAFVVIRGQSHDGVPVASPSRTAAPTGSGPESSDDETLVAVYERGRDTARSHDIVRGGSAQGTCKQVRVGTSPQQMAVRALHRTLPGYRVIDVSRIIDQSAGLCALQIRAHDGTGNVALVSVTSPAFGPVAHNQALTAHGKNFHGLFVEYARFASHDGWQIVVGTSGLWGNQPSSTLLGELAMNPALRW